METRELELIIKRVAQSENNETFLGDLDKGIVCFNNLQGSYDLNQRLQSTYINYMKVSYPQIVGEKELTMALYMREQGKI